jgi:hypothetical protein
VTRALATLVALALLSACGPMRGRGGLLGSEEKCEFVVLNATNWALDVRRYEGTRYEPRRAMNIGTLNPSEQLTQTVSCREERVFIAGLPLPVQVGVQLGSPVFAFADLEPGKRAQLTLHWP